MVCLEAYVITKMGPFYIQALEPFKIFRTILIKYWVIFVSF